MIAMARQTYQVPFQGSARLRAWMGLAAAGLAVGVAVTAATSGAAGSRLAARRAMRSSSMPARPVATDASTPGHEIDGWVAAAERGVAQNPKDAAAYRVLAVAFMRKQRQCGD